MPQSFRALFRPARFSSRSSTSIERAGNCGGFNILGCNASIKLGIGFNGTFHALILDLPSASSISRSTAL
jgi:hypothetical protein